MHVGLDVAVVAAVAMDVVVVVVENVPTESVLSSRSLSSSVYSSSQSIFVC